MKRRDLIIWFVVTALLAIWAFYIERDCSAGCGANELVKQAAG